jgi:GT2 family glycosyltransferase
MKKLTAVIPTFNRKDCLVRLLETLKKQEIKGMELSIIVVVDGSTDGTQETVRSRFPGVIIIEGDGHWWWTRSVNEGCKQAVKNGADAVMLLNDDIRLEPRYLRNLLTAAQQEPGAVIGSLNVTAEKEKRIFFSGAPRYQWYKGKLQRYHPFLSPYDGSLSGLQPSVVLPGRGLWIPVEVIEKIGFFDEKSLPQYKADYDFVMRANKHGIKTFISWDTIVYVQTAATGKGATFTRQSFFSFLTSLFKKNTRTNLSQNFLYYIRYYPIGILPIFPLTVFMIIARQLFSFLRDRKY